MRMACIAPATLIAATATLVWTSAAQPQPDLFAPIAAVLQHPRCLNCHVKDDTPLNGDQGRPHRMKITRGADDRGAPAARCEACHRAPVDGPSFVPAVSGWRLPPKTMGWYGLSAVDLCRVLRDPAQPDHLDDVALIKHMETDPIVGSGWQPGGDRTLIPISRAELVDLVKAWTRAGMPCSAP
jgi:hypothetical protein